MKKIFFALIVIISGLVAGILIENRFAISQIVFQSELHFKPCTICFVTVPQRLNTSPVATN